MVQQSQNIDYLINYKNYYVYADMVKNRTTHKIYVPEDLSIMNIDDHIDAVFNILKDGIETDYVHNAKVKLIWPDIKCGLSLPDYWLNLFMWSMILKTNHKIAPYHIFVGSIGNNYHSEDEYQNPYELVRKDIKNYVNKYILTLDNKINIGNTRLNQIIADGLWYFSNLEHFAYYLANTINNEDDIDLMRSVPEFDSLIHTSLAGVPFEEVKDRGMEFTNRAIQIIKDSERYIGYEHGLTNSFRANEAINPRQYKEASLNIGTKPNNSGGIHPYIIDKNFKTGGVNDRIAYFIESGSARKAQILSKLNVGESGDLARKLGLNNTDTILNLDYNYECMSQHFIRFEIKSKKHLSVIKNRYFRFNPRGIDRIINEDDNTLIGTTVFLHSPITCASMASGHGVCKKCYGNLYWVNNNINVGKIAAEILSSQLTQTLLSAKHLLETKVINIKWNPEFKDYFDIDINCIRLSEDIDDESMLKKYTMIIDPEDVQLVNEEEEAVSYDDDGNQILVELNEDTGVYNEYITSFIIKTPDGREIVFGSESQHELYISQELNSLIRKKAYNSNNKVNINLNSLMDDVLFYIKINNNEISQTMDDIVNIIDKSSVTEKLTKDEAVQSLVDLTIEGNLNIDSIHLEMVLANQIVSKEDILKKPNWNDPNAQYRLLTLNQALTNSPSVIKGLLYKDLKKVLYNPLTFTKNAPSFFDLFFHEQPQVYMNDELLTTDTSLIRDPDKGVPLYKVIREPRDEEFLKKIEQYMSPEDFNS